MRNIRSRSLKWIGEAWERLCPEWKGGRSSPLVDVRTGGPSAPVRELVDRLAGYGYTVTEISRLTGLRPMTIFRQFRDELTTSALRRDMEVIESAFQQAVGGPERDFRRADASMTRFWLGQRRGWKQPTAYDKLPGDKGVLDLDRLSEDELHELERLLGRAGDAEGG